MERDFDITKLSKKVRFYIEALENNLKSSEGRLKRAIGETKSAVEVSPFGDEKKYLSPDETVRFWFGDHHREYIDVRLEDKKLLVMAGEALDIRPKATNVATLRNGKMFEY